MYWAILQGGGLLEFDFVSAMDIKAAVLPGAEDSGSLGRQEVEARQPLEHFGAKEFFQGLERQ